VDVVASLSQGRTAAAQCGLFTHKSVPVIFEPPCTFHLYCITCEKINRSEIYMYIVLSHVRVSSYEKFANIDFCRGAANCSSRFWNITSLHRVIGSLCNFLKIKPIGMCSFAK